jgi:hypothetical protein
MLLNRYPKKGDEMELKKKIKAPIFYLGIILFVTSCDTAVDTDTTIVTISPKITATEIITTATKDTVNILQTNTKEKQEEPILTEDNVNEIIMKGEYLVYTDISEGVVTSYLYPRKGPNKIALYESADSYNMFLSGDQQRIAIKEFSWDYLRLYNIYSKTSIIFTDKYNCIKERHAVFLTWSMEKDYLAIYCGYKIVVVDGLTGERIGEIRNSEYGDANRHYPLSWSPNGRWMVFDIFAEGDKIDSSKGAFIVNTSCIMDDKECNFLFAKAPYFSAEFMRWRYDNLLSFEEEDNKIILYDPEEERKVGEVDVPTEYGVGITSFSWSSDNDYLAFETNMGLFTMEIQTGKVEKITERGKVMFWVDIV